MTPLETLIRERIAAEGPMPISTYMELCLSHPQHGYYMTRDPLGRGGDFITAPEVSQMFGELIGIWCILAWQSIGAPKAFNLIELGPGRGTLMSDLLRATKAQQSFAEALRVHLVETSPVLKQRQEQMLGNLPVWHDSPESVPQGPCIIIANEFFDALPIDQYERRDGQWFRRCIGAGRDGGLEATAIPDSFSRPGKDGDILETSAARDTVAAIIGRHLKGNPGTFLVIDYGHVRSAPGDTLQAVRRHAYVPITNDPGQVDLTAHVDFEALIDAIKSAGADPWIPITQRQFLMDLGLEARAAELARKDHEAILSAVQRLAGADQMGNLFKVFAASSPDIHTLYPFSRP